MFAKLVNVEDYRILAQRRRFGRHFFRPTLLTGASIIPLKSVFWLVSPQVTDGPITVDFGTLGDFSRYIASFLFQGWHRNS